MGPFLVSLCPGPQLQSPKRHDSATKIPVQECESTFLNIDLPPGYFTLNLQLKANIMVLGRGGCPEIEQNSCVLGWQCRRPSHWKATVSETVIQAARFAQIPTLRPHVGSKYCNFAESNYAGTTVPWSRVKGGLMSVKQKCGIHLLRSRSQRPYTMYPTPQAVVRRQKFVCCERTRSLCTEVVLTPE